MDCAFAACNNIKFVNCIVQTHDLIFLSTYSINSDTGVLRSPTLIMHLSIYFCISVHILLFFFFFCFIVSIERVLFFLPMN